MARSKPRQEFPFFFFGREGFFLFEAGVVLEAKQVVLRGHFDGHASPRLANSISTQSGSGDIRGEKGCLNKSGDESPPQRTSRRGRGGRL